MNGIRYSIKKKQTADTHNMNLTDIMLSENRQIQKDTY